MQDTENKSKRKRNMGDYIVLGFAIGTLAGIILGYMIQGILIGTCLGVLIGAVASMRS